MSLPYLQSALERMLPRRTLGYFGLSIPELTPNFTLGQFQNANMLHPFLSAIEVDVFDAERRKYKLTYRSHGPVEDAPDSERNLANLEFRSVSPASLVKSFVDRPTYESLASTVSELVSTFTYGTGDTKNKNPAKTHAIREIGKGTAKDITQVTTFARPLTHQELVSLMYLLPHGGITIDKEHLRLIYQNVLGSAYKMAEQAGLKLQDVKS